MKVLIVGGGPSGLTACHNLAKRGSGIDVQLLEKQKRLGGLAKSFVYEGKYVFDIGPKRFHTEDKQVLGFIEEIREECSLVTIGRSSKVHFLNRVFDWPLSSKALITMPIGTGIRATIDLLKKRHFTSEELQSFENYIMMKYGKTLFELFFKPYTEKFLQRPISEIHSDWATTGINRSIINKENKGNSLVELVHRMLLPVPVKADFLYPEKGGFGAFWESCETVCRASTGVTLRSEATVTSVHRSGNKLRASLSDGSEAECDYLLWSGRMPDLLRAIGAPSSAMPSLEFIDTVFLDLVFEDKDIRSREGVCQWLYVSAGDLAISRISFPKCLIETNIPQGYEGLCVEVTAKENDGPINQQRLLSQVIKELEDMHIIRSGAKPVVCEIHREQSTYPIYHRTYRNEVAAALKIIGSFSDRIIPMGRCGSYWYNNSDHSIKQALKLTDDIIAGERPSFDCYGFFGGTLGGASPYEASSAPAEECEKQAVNH